MSTASPTIQRNRASELSAAASLFVLTIRQHTHGKRAYVLALLYALPCLLVMLIRVLSKGSVRPDHLEFGFAFNLFPHALAPLTALLYAAGIIRDEIEDQTLTYLLMRSVPRWLIYIVKLCATVVITSALVTLAISSLYVFIYWGTPELTGQILASRLPRYIMATLLTQFAYGALFGFVGLATRRSLVAGVAYIFAIEGVIANIPFVGRMLTIVFYFRTLILRWLDLPAEVVTQAARTWSMDLEIIPTTSECVTKLLVFGAGLGLLSALWFARREFYVKTPGE